MILRRLSVEGFRCFRSAVAIEELSEGLNILSGPNESGKSTLVDALIRAFFDRHKTGGGDIELDRPWGTDLTPRVSVDFETGGKTYRIEKSFIGNKSSRLLERIDVRFEPLAEGDDADRRTSELLMGELPGRGTSDARNWGIARVLWSRQDGARLQSPDPTGPLGDRLRSLLARELTDETEGKLLAAIEQAESEHFHKRTGKLKKTSSAALAEEETSRLAGELAGLRARIARSEEHRQAVAAAELKLDRLESERKETLERRDAAARELAGLGELRRRIELAESQLRQAAAELESLEQQRRRLDDLDLRRAARAHSLSDMRLRIEVLDRELAGAGEALSARRSRAAEAQEAEDTATRELRKMETLRRLHEVEKARCELQQKLRECRSAEEAVTALERETESMPAPGAGDLKKAQKLHERQLELKARVESSGLTATVTALRDLEAIVDSGGGEERAALASGESRSVSSAARIRIEMPGVARIAISCGARDLQELGRELEEAGHELDALLDRHGAADLAALRELRERRLSAEAALDARRQKLQGLLGSHESCAALERELELAAGRAARHREELGSARSSVRPDPVLLSVRPDPSTLRQAQGSGEGERSHGDSPMPIDAATRALEEVRAARKRLEREVAEGETRLAELRARHDAELRSESEARADKGAVEAQLAELLAACGGRDRLLESTTEAAGRLVAAQATLERCRSELPPPESDPAPKLERLERSLEDIHREVAAQRDLRSQLRGQLEEAGSGGLYSRLAGLEEQLALAGSRRDVLEREARAARLLAAIARARRSHQVEALVGPVEDRLNRYYRSVTGVSARQIRLDERLVPRGIELPRERSGLDSPLPPVASLSSGASEQLALAVRLCLARYLASEERQLVVLDDSLVFTDDDRQQRVLDLLGAAAQELQILVLTCHPERFRGLPGSKLIHLPDLRRG